MTCVVAAKDKSDGRIWMGGDSAAVCENTRFAISTPKVFRRGAFLIGYAVSFRAGQIVQHVFEPPSAEGVKNAERFMISTFVPSLRKCFVDNSFIKEDYDASDASTESFIFLVGFHGHLFRVEHTFGVLEPASEFDAIGAGSDFAVGSMCETGRLSAKTRVQKALTAAQRYCSAVAEPFHIRSLGAPVGLNGAAESAAPADGEQDA